MLTTEGRLVLRAQAGFVMFERHEQQKGGLGDLATNQIVIRDGKGRKDRVTMLPAAIKAALITHLGRVREYHQADLRRGAG